ncbi:MAG: monovalent cation/H+ antiporter subunit D family protein [Rhodospirillaceae bacterium]|jgi:multicomponent Na+:H+ antiporter subunit D|nr:monovalent cation/H+ antiporter subunit D family protein [Rhodospirillaceae bacterium]
MELSDFIVAAFLIPIIGAFFIASSGSKPNVREAYTLGTAALLFMVVLIILPTVMQGGRPSTEGLTVLPGLEVRFVIEPMGMIFALIASTLWIVNSIYSIGYMRGNKEKKQTIFYTCFAIAIASTIGIAFAGNLFTLFLFYEVLTLSTYPLVTHKGDDAAKAGGRMYLGILLTTSVVFLLPAVIGTYYVAGTGDFTVGGIIPADESPIVIGALGVLFIYGIGKAAVMPVHRWLPAAMVAPTPVSALLHAVAVVKAGVFTVVKVIVYVFGLDLFSGVDATSWVVYAAGFTVLVASIIALGQDNLKRRLAYSTVSQLSYVVLAAAMATPLAIIGAAMHITAHAFGKITLFFAAGSIYTAAHKTEISQLNGIGKRMPITMAAFTIGALSMIGVPPTAGFLGKWYILSAAMEIKDWFVLFVIFVSTLLNTAYFMPIVYRAFMKDEDVPPEHEHGEAPWPVVLALSLTALGTLSLFLFPEVPLTLAKALVGQSL